MVPEVLMPVDEPLVVPEVLMPEVVPLVLPDVLIPEVEPLVIPEVEPDVEPLVVPAFSLVVQLVRASDEHRTTPVSAESHLRFIRKREK